MRQNRTVTVDFGMSYEEYIALHDNTGWFLKRVVVVMQLVMLSMHSEECTLSHRYTRHSTRERVIICLRKGPVMIPISQIRCVECRTVFTVMPSFMVRYKHYEIHLAQALLENNLISNVSYRFQQRLFESLTGSTAGGTPMTLWRLMKWLGHSTTVTSLLMKLGLTPPTTFQEDEKFVSEAGQQTYIAALFHADLIWHIDYLHSTDERSLTASLLRYKETIERDQPGYAPESVTMDSHAASQSAVANVFPSSPIQECLLHAQRNVNKDLATYRRRQPEVQPEFLESIGSGTWSALTTSRSEEEFCGRIRKLKESTNGDPLLNSRLDKLILRHKMLMQYLKTPSVDTTSTNLDQSFKWLNRKFFQMQSFMTEEGAKAFSNAWAIARDMWRFMKDAKKAGESPVELAGADLRGRGWLEVVNLVVAGVFIQA